MSVCVCVGGGGGCFVTLRVTIGDIDFHEPCLPPESHFFPNQLEVTVGLQTLLYFYTEHSHLQKGGLLNLCCLEGHL